MIKMDNDLSLNIPEDTFHKMIKIKNEMGYEDKNWNEWFIHLINNLKKDESEKEIIERVFKNGTIRFFFDEWVKNLALNLENIWKEKSIGELIPKNIETKSSAIIIGRGPSIERHNHLKLLAESDYDGTIICADGAMPKVLKSGVTPDRFKKFYCLTVDAQEWQQDFFLEPICKKFGKQIRCILSTTASPKVYYAAKAAGMNVYWTHTLIDYNRDKTSFNKIAGLMTRVKNHKNGIPAIQTGANVGTAAWIVAWSIFKCPTVGLIGIDHGYDADTSWDKIESHSAPITKDMTEDKKIFDRAYPTIYNPFFNSYCKQDPPFVYYSNALKEFAKRTKNKVKTINATEGGAIFGDGIECMKFSDFLEKFNK